MSVSFNWNVPCRDGDVGMAGYFLNRSLFGGGPLGVDSGYCQRLRERSLLLLNEDPTVGVTVGDALVSTFSQRGYLSDHQGCVNSIEFNPDCGLLVTGSDDMHVCIYDARDRWKLLAKVPTSHQRNIFSAQMMPATNNRVLLTCGLDGAVIQTDTETHQTHSILRERFSMAAKVLPIGGSCHCPNSSFAPSVALSIFDDGRLHFIDTREGGAVQASRQFRKIQLTPNLQAPPLPLNCIVQHPHNCNIIALGSEESYVSLCDVRYLATSGDSFNGNGSFLRLTTLQPREAKRGVGGIGFSEKGDRLLINYKDAPLFSVEWVAHLGSSQVVLDNMSETTTVMISGTAPLVADASDQRDSKGKSRARDFFSAVMGDEESPIVDEDVVETAFSKSVLVDTRALRMSERQNSITMYKEPTFLLDDKFIATGSDDGFVYFWEADSGALVHKTRLDSDIVNGVLYHQNHPNTLITCGIDKSVKISQIHPVYSHSKEFSEPLPSRNLIGEKRDRDHPILQQTVFVSTSSLNHEIAARWSEALELRGIHNDDFWDPVPTVSKVALAERRDELLAKVPISVREMNETEGNSHLFEMMGRGGYSDPIIKPALLHWMFTRLLECTNVAKRQKWLTALALYMPIIPDDERAQILRRFDLSGEALSNMPLYPLNMRQNLKDDPEVDPAFAKFGWWDVIITSQRNFLPRPAPEVEVPEGEEDEWEFTDEDDAEQSEEADMFGDETSEEVMESEESEEDDGSEVLGRLSEMKLQAALALPPVLLERVADVPSEYHPTFRNVSEDAITAFGVFEDFLSAFSSGGQRYALTFSTTAPFLPEGREYHDLPAVRALVQVGSRVESLALGVDYWLKPSPSPLLVTHGEMLFIEHQAHQMRSSIRTLILPDSCPESPFEYISRSRKKINTAGDSLGAMEAHMALVHDANQLLVNPLVANITGDCSMIMDRTALLLKVSMHVFSAQEDCEPLDGVGRAVRASRRLLRNVAPLVVYQPDKEVADGRSKISESALTPTRNVQGRYTTRDKPVFSIPVVQAPGQLFDFKKCGGAAQSATPSYLVEQHGRPCRTNDDIEGSLARWDAVRPTLRQVAGVAGELMRAEPNRCISRHSREAVFLSRDIFHAIVRGKKAEKQSKTTKVKKMPASSSASASSPTVYFPPPHSVSYVVAIPFQTAVPRDFPYLRRFCVAQELRSLVLGVLETQSQLCFGSALHEISTPTIKAQVTFLTRLAEFRTAHPEVVPFIPKAMLDQALAELKRRRPAGDVSALPAEKAPPVEPSLDVEGISLGKYFTEEEKRLFGEEEWMDVARYRAIAMCRSPLYFCDTYNGIDNPRKFIPLTVDDYHERHTEIFGDGPVAYSGSLKKSQHTSKLAKMFAQGKALAQGADDNDSSSAPSDDESDGPGFVVLRAKKDPMNNFEREMFEKMRMDYLNPKRRFVFDYCKAISYETCGATNHIHSRIVSKVIGQFGFPPTSVNSEIHATKMKTTLRWSAVDSGVHPLAFVMNPAEINSQPNPAWDGVRQAAKATIKNNEWLSKEMKDVNLKAMESAVQHEATTLENSNAYELYRPKDDLKNWVRYSQVMEQAVCNLETILWAMYRLLIILKERDGIEVEIACDRVQRGIIPDGPQLTKEALEEHSRRCALHFEDDEEPDGGIRLMRQRTYDADGGLRVWQPWYRDEGEPSCGSTATTGFLCDNHIVDDQGEEEDYHEGMMDDYHTDSRMAADYQSQFQDPIRMLLLHAFGDNPIAFQSYYEVQQLMSLADVFESYVPFLLKPLGSAQRSSRVLAAYEQFAQIKVAVGRMLADFDIPDNLKHVGNFIGSLNVSGFSVPSDPERSFDLPTSRPTVNPHFPSLPPHDPNFTPAYNSLFAYSSRYIIPALNLIETLLKSTNDGEDVDEEDDTSHALRTIPQFINSMLEGIPTDHPLRKEAARVAEPFRHLIPRLDL